MSKVACPDCGAMVEPKPKAPYKKPYIYGIPPHSTLKGEDSRKNCPGTNKTVPNYKPAEGLVG